MASTFQKRQKEMKRLEKQRAKAERRAQKKLENDSGVKPREEFGVAGEAFEELGPAEDKAEPQS